MASSTLKDVSTDDEAHIEVDLGTFNDVLLDSDSDTKKVLKMFTSELVPVISTPRHDPYWFASASTSRLFKMVFKVVVVEMILSAIPTIAKEYGGPRYVDQDYAFMGMPCVANTGVVLTMALMVCGIINACSLLIKPVWYPEAVWVKYAIYAAAVSLVVLHKAGDVRLELGILAAMLLGLVFTTPATSQKSTPVIYPMVCFVAFTLYVFLHKAATFHGETDPEVYLGLAQITFGIGLPLAACCLPLCFRLASPFMESPPTDIHYLVMELVVACSLVVSGVIPVNVK